MSQKTPETPKTATPAPETATAEIADNLTALRARMEGAALAARRSAASVTLVAVSKMQPAARIEAALAAGQRVFGENRVQEAQSRWPALREQYPDIILHLIGPLQTNKLRDAVALFDVIETVDRPRLAQALRREMDRAGVERRCCIQVNTGEEAQKSGISPRDADAFIAECRDTLTLPVTGLMCIPPASAEPALHFALLRTIAARNRLNILSMGMSADFETAIELGTTHVRVGSALFGSRLERRPE